MRVLVVDPDVQFSSLLVECLEEGGHEAVCADNPQKLDALLRIRSVDAVVIDLSRRRMNGFDLARSLRKDSGGHLRIVLVSPSHQEGDAEVDALSQEVKASAFFSRPFELEQVMSALSQPHVAAVSPSPKSAASGMSKKPETFPSTPERATPKPKARTRKPVHWDNARELMSYWCERESGILSVSKGGRSGEVSLRDGGIVDPTAISFVELALDGAEMRFTKQHVEGRGDWALLGNQVFVRCRHACEDGTVLGYMKATPTAVPMTEMARALTITGPTRRLMGVLDGTASLETLLSRCQATPSEVSSDIEALVQLNMLRLQRGEVQTAPQPEVGVEVSGGERQALQGARSSSDLQGLPSMGQSAVASAHKSEGSEVVLARLERELQTIEEAAPPVVLGVPEDASTALVDEAAARMRNRYIVLARDVSLSSEARDIAQRIGRIIDSAHRRFAFQGTEVVEEEAPNRSPVDLLLEEGRSLISKGEWAQADSVLTKAHRQQLDHAGVLSNLGWARLHNPDRPQDARADEGRDFLLLSEQFDPTNVDGQYFLAQYLLAANLVEAAAQRAQRAKEAAPGEPARAALHRKIQIALSSQQG